MRRPAFPPPAVGLAIGLLAWTAAAVLAARDLLLPAVMVLVVATLILSYGMRQRARAQLLYDRGADQDDATSPSPPADSGGRTTASHWHRKAPG